jgi:hypothetical protein
MPPQPAPLALRSRVGIPPETIAYQRKRMQHFMDGD